MPSAMAVSTNVADFALKLMRDTHMISVLGLRGKVLVAGRLQGWLL